MAQGIRGWKSGGTEVLRGLLVLLAVGSLAVERTERLVSAGKDVSGAGASFISPGWLTALQRNWGDAASAVRVPPVTLRQRPPKRCFGRR